MSTLYLIPCTIAEGTDEQVLPTGNKLIINRLDYFIVENIRSARRFLSAQKIERRIDELDFAECSEHTKPEEVEALIAPLKLGRNGGFISEAGMAGVADPGAEVVAACHAAGIDVVPLVGPNSIVMALAASGLNGQSFAFNGYLPVKQPARNQAIKHFEHRAHAEHQSQIFIEAPYRNGALFGDFMAICSPSTRLTVATDITAENEFIRTFTIAQWRRTTQPELHKRPTIFILG